MGGAQRPRLRDCGISIGILPPGPMNAITDVPGVTVGHVTLVKGEGRLVPGQGPVRTGVTAVIPHPGNLFKDKVRAAIHVINGFGKATGIAQVQELGVMETPIVLTNTLSVGTAWDALCEYMLEQNPDIGITTGTVNPVVAECNDGYLNDIRGRHVKAEHVMEALKKASGGIVLEGNVGAGTGMSCLGFKGGIGSSSRVIESELGDRYLGVLVLANFGRLIDLTIAGVPVGREISRAYQTPPAPPGSIVIVVATDCPVTERQLQRIARRCQGGLARVGSVFSNGSGDFVIAFSTENRVPHKGKIPPQEFISDDSEEMARLFRASVEATEEAVLNALFRAETMVGRDDHKREALPVETVLEIMMDRGVAGRR